MNIYAMLTNSVQKNILVTADSDILPVIAFWKTWSKFDKSARCGQVDGSVDADAVADKLVSHFRKAFTCNNPKTAESLRAEYFASRADRVLAKSPIFDLFSLEATQR